MSKPAENFFKLILERERGRKGDREGGRDRGRGGEREKEKHRFVVPLIYAFVGCFFYVS